MATRRQTQPSAGIDDARLQAHAFCNGAYTLRALDDAFAGFDQHWKDPAKQNLMGLVKLLNRLIAATGDPGSDPTARSDLTVAVAQAIAGTRARLDPTSTNGQIAALTWLRDSVEEILATKGDITDMSMLHQLTVIMLAAAEQFGSQP